MPTTKHIQICDKIEKYLKDNETTFRNWKIIENNKMYLSEEIIDYLFDNKWCYDKTSIDVVDKRINSLTTFNYFWLKELFLQIQIVDFTDYELASPINNSIIKEQQLFTFTIQSLLNNKFTNDNLILKIEDDFLNNERFGNIYTSYNRGYRVDIVIDSIKLVIEYDERQHESYEHTIADAERDKLIVALGYHVIRYSRNINMLRFISDLTALIKKRIYLFNPNKLLEYVINILK